MGKIIDERGLGRHRVEKYQFEALDLDLEEEEPFDPSIFSTTTESEPPHKEEKEQSTSPETTELLEKIEALSAEITSLQTTLDIERKEREKEIEEAKEKAFAKGKEEGIRETQQALQESLDETRIQMHKSITDLQETMEHYHERFDRLEEEVSQSALLIAQQIIASAVESDSAKIARKIAQTLIEELKEATHITLHINPADAALLEESLGKEPRVSIKSNNAVTPGGVILYSDAGNIDGTLEARIKRTIALLQKES
ncbi:MAG: hypothetical protein B6D59_06005 [Campylobacteraceae bacterium 4484_4]|nr:MAG: hypothetical protein B6D59_06005 [Campylobacteraceae bacterium 4484_4]